MENMPGRNVRQTQGFFKHHFLNDCTLIRGGAVVPCFEQNRREVCHELKVLTSIYCLRTYNDISSGLFLLLFKLCRACVALRGPRILFGSNLEASSSFGRNMTMGR